MSIQQLQDLLLPAPLAGITNEPFRLLLKEIGAKVTWTEMISADGLERKQDKTYKIASIRKESPIIVAQLFGSSPETIFKAANILVQHFGYEYIDINLGCPAKKIVKKGAGVKLMDNPETVKKIFNLLRKLPATIFAKIRKGTTKNNSNYLEIINILYNEGVNGVTIHPRAGNEFFQGKADWECIRIVKERFPKLFIIGNGDVENYQDAMNMKRITGCNAVMVGRAMAKNPFLMENPNLSQNENFERKIPLQEKIEIFKTLLYCIMEFYNEKISLNLAKKYLILFTKSYKNSGKLRRDIIKIKNCIEILQYLMYWEENN